jgi:protoheme IX farnesyltransferase
MSVVQVSRRTDAWAIAGAYYQLTKPTVVMLMLVTGLPAILMAGHGAVSLVTLIVALVGTALAAGSAAALNHYWDRDIDSVMERTSRRPLPSGAVRPNQVLFFGLVLGVVSVGMLAWWTTWLAAAIALGSILFYVVVYTMWLKRVTPQNIVIGGAAGASAPLIGWAAVTGTVGLPALLMGLVIFLWTPPHFWALALYRREDYARAAVPMMPVVAGEDSTRLQMLVYTLLLVPTTLALVAIRASGLIYLLAALPLGARFGWDAARLKATKSDARAKRLFLYSIVYLLILFVFLFLDVVARIAWPTVLGGWL